MTKVVCRGLFLLGIPALLAHQLGRRNLTPGEESYLRGERYKLEKQAHGGTGANQHTNEQSGKNVHSAKTVEKLSSQYKVSPKTIRNDASYAADINTIAAVADTQGSSIVMELALTSYALATSSWTPRQPSESRAGWCSRCGLEHVYA